MKSLENRLQALEARDDGSKSLPDVIYLPSSEPDRTKVLADVERLRQRGRTVVTVEDGANPLDALIDTGLFA
ncbi:MAG TPA: hypothetical protein PLL92_07080 [Alicycliphilus sp.]|nr:hypothetical protein [Alicycliphilus sp.]